MKHTSNKQEFLIVIVLSKKDKDNIENIMKGIITHL